MSENDFTVKISADEINDREPLPTVIDEDEWQWVSNKSPSMSDWQQDFETALRQRISWVRRVQWDFPLNLDQVPELTVSFNTVPEIPERFYFITNYSKSMIEQEPEYVIDDIIRTYQDECAAKGYRFPTLN